MLFITNHLDKFVTFLISVFTFLFSSMTMPTSRPATAPHRCPMYLDITCYESGLGGDMFNGVPGVGLDTTVVVVDGVGDIKHGEGDNKC